VGVSQVRVKQHVFETSFKLRGSASNSGCCCYWTARPLRSFAFGFCVRLRASVQLNSSISWAVLCSFSEKKDKAMAKRFMS
jgi:hypothetical protein